MSISIENLKPADVGKWVVYTPLKGASERGRIKSWNDKWIFVVYKCDNNWDKFADYTGCATDPSELNYQEQCDKCGDPNIYRKWEGCKLCRICFEDLLAEAKSLNEPEEVDNESG